MNKKLLVLAVTSAVAASAAHADTANVNVYGKLYPQFTIAKAQGVPNTHRVDSSNSAIGFRGDADIGGGMKGWFKVEQRLRLDTGNGTWSSRNSAAGLSGGFGNVFLGNWDTVYKQLGAPVSFLGLSSGNFVSTSAVITETFNGEGSFHRRRNSYLQYETPEVGGFQFLIGYGPDEGKTNTTDTSLMTFGAKWEAGPLYVALAHEIHNDESTASDILGTAAGTDSKDSATRLSVAYSLPTGTKVGVTFATMEYEENGVGTTATYEHDAYDLTVTHKVGNTSFALAYGNSDAGSCSITGTTCTVGQVGANQIALGVRHDFNKRVGVFGLATKVNNDPGAAHDPVGLTGLAAGADPQAIAAGVLVTF